MGKYSKQKGFRTLNKVRNSKKSGYYTEFAWRKLL